jgi:hypothetical protein
MRIPWPPVRLFCDATDRGRQRRHRHLPRRCSGTRHPRFLAGNPILLLIDPTPNDSDPSDEIRPEFWPLATLNELKRDNSQLERIVADNTAPKKVAKEN